MTFQSLQSYFDQFWQILILALYSKGSPIKILCESSRQIEADDANQSVWTCTLTNIYSTLISYCLLLHKIVSISEVISVGSGYIKRS